MLTGNFFAAILVQMFQMYRKGIQKLENTFERLTRKGGLSKEKIGET